MNPELELTKLVLFVSRARILHTKVRLRQQSSAKSLVVISSLRTMARRAKMGDSRSLWEDSSEGFQRERLELPRCGFLLPASKSREFSGGQLYGSSGAPREGRMISHNLWHVLEQVLRYRPCFGFRRHLRLILGTWGCTCCVSRVDGR